MLFFRCDRCGQEDGKQATKARIIDFYGATYAEICYECFDKLKIWMNEDILK